MRKPCPFFLISFILMLSTSMVTALLYSNQISIDNLSNPLMTEQTQDEEGEAESSPRVQVVEEDVHLPFNTEKPLVSGTSGETLFPAHVNLTAQLLYLEFLRPPTRS